MTEGLLLCLHSKIVEQKPLVMWKPLFYWRWHPNELCDKQYETLRQLSFHKALQVMCQLAHDELGHNGCTRAYMILKRLHYWKGLKPIVHKYVTQCRTCQQRKIQAVNYTNLYSNVPQTPMQFVSWI